MTNTQTITTMIPPSSALILRPYQEECIRRVLAAYEQDRHGEATIVLPTGAGKTVIFCQVTQKLSERYGLTSLIIAHRDELLEQAAEKYRLVKPDAIIGKVGAGRHEYGGEVTVASIATISRPEHLHRLKAIGYGLLICVEAHHLASASYQAVLNALPDAFVLKVTATPDRLDGKDITNGKAPLYSASIIDLIADGYLCDVKAIAIRTEASLDHLHTELGDYNTSELEAAVDTPARNARVVEAYQEHAAGRRAICFAVTVEHAIHLADAFNRAGTPAAVVSGETRLVERKQLYKRLREGVIKVLTNVQVLIEGYDEPLVNCIVMARPTQSRALYCQCLDAATQILTPAGWKFHYEIQAGDPVAGFDTSTEAIRWVPALRKVERPLAPDETMFALHTPSLDIRVTGGHRMVYRTRCRSKGTRTQWKFLEAQELSERMSEYEIPLAGQQHAPGVPLTDDELHFLGWFLTDGTLNKTTGAIIISQAAHQPHHDAIRSCLIGCGFKFSVYETAPRSQYHATSNSIRYIISKGLPRGTDKHLTGWAKLEPYIDKDFSPLLDEMTRAQLEVLLEAIHLGDGAKQRGQTWTRRSYHITKGNKTFVERLQSLCVRRGFKCNVTPIQRETGPCYLLHIKNVSARYVGGNHAADRPHFEMSPRVPGETVWCVENELSTLVTRRNGKVAIVGNCIGRGLRLAPAKADCLILDLTDNCLKHRLEPQNLRTALGKSLKEAESVRECLEREVREERERATRATTLVRTLKEIRTADLTVNLLARLDWKELPDGSYMLEVGPERHRIMLVPAPDSLSYAVWAKLAPAFVPQCWLQDAPLDWAQQYAEGQTRTLLSKKNATVLVDRTAAWRCLPVNPESAQAHHLKRFRVPQWWTLTRGEASDLLGSLFDAERTQRAERKARKAHGKRARGA